ncbi:TPA-induced transmembrane protein isoform X2 [Leopardus geoffroyi]|uniref:TPA-induced transmembrane protein isoform X2 n=1 Tax=Leopardus geoffroyi TaxID=46844 RepID=UPI001E262E97|nr:TPA-induced transmembrane protein isoform X2 [Leopardus geoffroyi]
MNLALGRERWGKPRQQTAPGGGMLPFLHGTAVRTHPGRSCHPTGPGLSFCFGSARTGKGRAGSALNKPEKQPSSALLASPRRRGGSTPAGARGASPSPVPPRPARRPRSAPPRPRGAECELAGRPLWTLHPYVCAPYFPRVSRPLPAHGRGRIPIDGGRAGALGARGAARRAEASQRNRPGHPSLGRGAPRSPATYIDEDENEILELSSNKTFLVELKIPEDCVTEEELPHQLRKRLTDVYSSSPSLSRYFTSVEITDFSENATVAYHLQFGVPSEDDSFMKYMMSKELVLGILLQDLHDQRVSGCETLGLDPASLLLYE